MKFWTFLKKKIGALDCNWCIILFMCKEMSLGGGDQRLGGGGGGYPRAPPLLYETLRRMIKLLGLPRDIELESQLRPVVKSEWPGKVRP